MPMFLVSRSEPLAKRELHERLRQWVRGKDDAKIGDPEVQGRKAWIWVLEGSELFNLHADTTRAAVEKYLRLVDVHGDDVSWAVVPSAKGKLTKVAFGPDLQKIKGFYLYRG